VARNAARHLPAKNDALVVSPAAPRILSVPSGSVGTGGSAHAIPAISLALQQKSRTTHPPSTSPGSAMIFVHVFG
jgi:hypothetical protein